MIPQEWPEKIVCGFRNRNYGLSLRTIDSK